MAQTTMQARSQVLGGAAIAFAIVLIFVGLVGLALLFGYYATPLIHFVPFIFLVLALLGGYSGYFAGLAAIVATHLVILYLGSQGALPTPAAMSGDEVMWLSLLGYGMAMLLTAPFLYWYVRQAEAGYKRLVAQATSLQGKVSMVEQQLGLSVTYPQVVYPDDGGPMMHTITPVKLSLYFGLIINGLEVIFSYFNGSPAVLVQGLAYTEFAYFALVGLFLLLANRHFAISIYLLVIFGIIVGVIGTSHHYGLYANPFLAILPLPIVGASLNVGRRGWWVGMAAMLLVNVVLLILYAVGVGWLPAPMPMSSELWIQESAGSYLQVVVIYALLLPYTIRVVSGKQQRLIKAVRLAEIRLYELAGQRRDRSLSI